MITPPSQKVETPKNVDPENRNVTFDEMCEIPMSRLGKEDGSREYKCAAQNGECIRSGQCPQYRMVPVDQGVFQGIPLANELADAALDARKNRERPFNLLKHREGLEQIRVRSQNSTVVRCAISTMATLFIELENRYNDREKDNPQRTVFNFAA